MKTAVGIFLHDLKALARNPFALVVALGLIVLPSVYAWYSIVAMWSPYSHTDGLKVAVVSEDAGASLADADKIEGVDAEALADKLGADGILNVGDLMVEAMKEDHSFDWQFVDAAQGESGLASGEYYAEFVMPESFSKDFLSVLSGDLERPTIEYWVNEKYNAVALEVTDAGAGVVDALVNRVFSALAADALSSVIKDVAADIIQAGSATKSSVSTGLSGASNDLEAVSEGLGDVAGTIDGWRTTTSDAEKVLDELKKTAPELRSSIDDAEKALADVRTSAHKVNSTYSSALAEGGTALSSALDGVADDVIEVVSAISEKQKGVDEELAAARKALDECDRLIAALKKVDPDSKTLANLEKQNEKLQQQIADLEELSSAVSEAATEAGASTDALSKSIGDAVKSMKKRNDSFNSDILPKLDSSLDAFAAVLGSLDGALGSLDAQIEQAKTLFEQLDGVLQKTEDAIDSTKDSLTDARNSIRSARSDLSALANSPAVRKVSSIANIDVKSYGSFMASPVSAQIQQVYPLNSYGAGVAPFYTSLAIWVGCFMLIAVIKLEADPELFPRMKPWQGYVGRLMLLAAMALLQGVVVSVGDMIVGVQAVAPPLFVVASLFTAFCFANIVYALAITFKHVGKALAVIFLIVQIPGASGMYPIQLMPDFFQALYPWLPFTYGMGAMREAIGGFYGGTYAQCLAWLLACGLAALALALIVRPRVLNLNRLFDRKLEAADVFITEEHGLGSDVVADRPVVDSLLETSVGRAQLMERADCFTRRYKLVQQAAPLAVVVLVVCLGVVSALLDLSVDGKLVALAAVIVAIVIVFCLCVVFEYVNDNLAAQLSVVTGAAYAAGAEGAFASASAAPVAVDPFVANAVPSSVPGETVFTDVTWDGAPGGFAAGEELEYGTADEPVEPDEPTESAESGEPGEYVELETPVEPAKLAKHARSADPAEKDADA